MVSSKDHLERRVRVYPQCMSHQLHPKLTRLNPLQVREAQQVGEAIALELITVQIQAYRHTIDILLPFTQLIDDTVFERITHEILSDEIVCIETGMNVKM